MTQENVEALATQEQGAVEEPQTTDTQEPDWKARYEEAEAGRLKTENALKSERGRLAQAQSMMDLKEDVGGIRARLDAFAKRTATGETESLPGDFSVLDHKEAAERAASKASADWLSGAAEAEISLAEALLDEDNNLLVSEEVKVSLAAAWQEALQRQDVHELYKVVGRANKEARSAERAKVETEAAAAKKVSDTKHGVHDLSLPTPAGTGGGGKSWASAQKITSVDDISDADYEKLVAGSTG